jgi:hypothetical protein
MGALAHVHHSAMPVTPDSAPPQAEDAAVLDTMVANETRIILTLN